MPHGRSEERPGLSPGRFATSQPGRTPVKRMRARRAALVPHRQVTLGMCMPALPIDERAPLNATVLRDAAGIPLSPSHPRHYRTGAVSPRPLANGGGHDLAGLRSASVAWVLEDRPEPVAPVGLM